MRNLGAAEVGAGAPIMFFIHKNFLVTELKRENYKILVESGGRCVCILKDWFKPTFDLFLT
jgi:hypothetical protein